MPPTKVDLFYPATEGNVPKLKAFLIDHFKSSAFNVCETLPLPIMKGSPPLQLHVPSNTKLVACHTPATIPLHWRDKVKAGLDQDLKLKVIEKVPLNKPVRWISRMVVTPKHNGNPRRTVNYTPVNPHYPRQTHHTKSPWTLAASVPEGVRKSVFNNWHGYHSLPLDSEEDKDLTAFITPFGWYRYLSAPKGLKPCGNAFTDRMDQLFQETKRSRQCVDDTLLYDETIEQQYYR